MLREFNEVKRFLGTKFGMGENEIINLKQK